MLFCRIFQIIPALNHIIEFELLDLQIFSSPLLIFVRHFGDLGWNLRYPGAIQSTAQAEAI